MEDDFEDLWCDEMADFIMENLISEMMSESGEKPVLLDDDGDPIFPQTESAFPLKEPPGANKVIRQRMNPKQRHSGWLWN